MSEKEIRVEGIVWLSVALVLASAFLSVADPDCMLGRCSFPAECTCRCHVESLISPSAMESPQNAVGVCACRFATAGTPPTDTGGARAFPALEDRRNPSADAFSLNL